MTRGSDITTVIVLPVVITRERLRPLPVFLVELTLVQSSSTAVRTACRLAEHIVLRCTQRKQVLLRRIEL